MRAGSIAVSHVTRSSVPHPHASTARRETRWIRAVLVEAGRSSRPRVGADDQGVVEARRPDRARREKDVERSRPDLQSLDTARPPGDAYELSRVVARDPHRSGTDGDCARPLPHLDSRTRYVQSCRRSSEGSRLRRRRSRGFRRGGDATGCGAGLDDRRLDGRRRSLRSRRRNDERRSRLQRAGHA